MASQTYERLLNALEPFIGRAKAEAAVARQLPRCNATPDSLTSAQVKQVLNFILGATKIHLAGNKERQDQLEAQLKSFT